MRQHQTHKALFLQYRDDTVVQKATQYAKWTLPQLMADLSTVTKGGTVVLERDYQEIGPLLVNNLASKLTALLFPHGRSFYKIKPSAKLKQSAKAKGLSETDLSSALAQLEMASCQQLFLNGSYDQLVLALKHLIVTGNVLVYRNSDTEKTITYGVQSFSVRRDGQGNVMCCILREYTDFESLKPEVQMAVALKNRSRYENPSAAARVELYTKIARGQDVNGKVIYTVTQEADDVPVGTAGVYPEHLCPWQAPCYSLIAGENYGRGLVEDYAGGFARLSDESHASILYSIEMGKLVNLVSPGSGANIDELQSAETGEYVQGANGAVEALEKGDAKKYEQMLASIDATFGRLARAFMYKGNTRDAERVTAEEIKQDALEAESTLGGVYSSLSASMQVPLAHLLLTETDESMLEGIIAKDVALDIIAGIPALGRQADVQNLAAAAQDAAAIIPALVPLSNKIDPDKIIAIIFAGHSVDPATVYKDKEQIQQEQIAAREQRQGQAMLAATTNLAEQQAALTSIQG